jgi:hypothetical protein
MFWRQSVLHIDAHKTQFIGHESAIHSLGVYIPENEAAAMDHNGQGASAFLGRFRRVDADHDLVSVSHFDILIMDVDVGDEPSERVSGLGHHIVHAFAHVLDGATEHVWQGALFVEELVGMVG